MNQIIIDQLLINNNNDDACERYFFLKSNWSHQGCTVFDPTTVKIILNNIK